MLSFIEGHVWIGLDWISMHGLNAHKDTMDGDRFGRQAMRTFVVLCHLSKWGMVMGGGWETCLCDWDWPGKEWGKIHVTLWANMFSSKFIVQMKDGTCQLLIEFMVLCFASTPRTKYVYISATAFVYFKITIKSSW